MNQGRIELPDSLRGLTRDEAGRCILPAGAHEICAPLRLTGSQFELRGAADPRNRTVLRRGRLADGQLYKGPLIEIEDARAVRLVDLELDGARFWRKGQVEHDRRHPLDPDRSTTLFLCGQVLTGSVARVSDFAPDLSVSGATALSLENLVLRDAVRIGVAIGPGCRDITISDCRVTAAGDYGVWLGGGLPDNLLLPLSSVLNDRLPTAIRIDDCLIERCGASGLYVEACDVSVSNSTFRHNHWDAPYDDEGGQIVIDYKARTVTLSACRILDGPGFLRSGPDKDSPPVLLGTFGIEASGEGLIFEDLVIKGNAREAVQLMGARAVEFRGGRTRIEQNQLARRVLPGCAEDGSAHAVSVTTTGALEAVNAVARGLRLDGIRCEGGVVLWPHPSAPGLRFDDLVIEACDLSGPESSGVLALDLADGGSIRGEGWRV